MHDRNVRRIVERVVAQQPGLAQHLLDALVTSLGQVGGALFLINLIVLFREPRDELVDLHVQIRLVLRRAGDDEGRARLIDQDRIHLIDDGERMSALHHLRQLVLHVVAQVVETELVVRAVGDVAGVGLTTLVIVQPMDDHADAQTQKTVDAPHPLRIAAGEVVVDGDDVNALPRERIQVSREGGDQRLALAGLHFGDGARMKHHAADQLDIEVPLPQRALRRFPNRREGGSQEVIEGLALLELRTKLLSLRAQLVVGELFDGRLKSIDLFDAWRVSLETTIVRRTKNLFRERAEHTKSFWTGSAPRRARAHPAFQSRPRRPTAALARENHPTVPPRKPRPEI